MQNIVLFKKSLAMNHTVRNMTVVV